MASKSEKIPDPFDARHDAGLENNQRQRTATAKRAMDAVRARRKEQQPSPFFVNQGLVAWRVVETVHPDRVAYGVQAPRRDPETGEEYWETLISKFDLPGDAHREAKAHAQITGKAHRVIEIVKRRDDREANWGPDAVHLPDLEIPAVVAAPDTDDLLEL